MKTLYFDCQMGAAGDMLTAALLDLLPADQQQMMIDRLNHIGIDQVEWKVENSIKCGISGKHADVLVGGVLEADLLEEASHHHHHDHHDENVHDHDLDHDHAHGHHHYGMDDITAIVEKLDASDQVKERVLRVYKRIAEAESYVHQTPVDQIHFHEVGSKDAVADVTAVCLLMEAIGPDQVIVSPIHVGSGHVHCAHGILPVPAPATAYILKGVPIYGGQIQGELCTPTGAALLTEFADKFGPMPVMKVEAIGYGCGNKDFEQANVVRAMLGQTEDDTGVVPELSLNVDDMTAEEIGFAVEQLFKAGAYEVYTVPIMMKKSRPGTLIRIICSEENKLDMVRCAYKYTTTIGIRETTTHRYTLERKEETVETSMGPVRRKTSKGYGTEVSKWEYDDVAKLADARKESIRRIRRQLDREQG
ncbi:MAG TPA: nickel pincer cofactor biosynthesis protein LarC [Lachnospiraceae bacterium]|nr:nickel pincer cofactor biosynthesis protein LarC [Lachnospiraceae bacterium]